MGRLYDRRPVAGRGPDPRGAVEARGEHALAVGAEARLHHDLAVAALPAQEGLADPEQIRLALPLQGQLGPDPGMAEEVVAEAEGEVEPVEQLGMGGGEAVPDLPLRGCEPFRLGLAQVELDAVAEQGRVATVAHPARRLFGIDAVGGNELPQP